MHDHDEEFEAKNRRLAINMDEEDEDDGVRHGGQLTLTMNAAAVEGEPVEASFSFDEEDVAFFFMTTANTQEEFDGLTKWLWILSLAGARTFAAPANLNLFIQPEPDWITLYFEQLPRAASDPLLSPLLWSVYTSIELSLKDSQGNVLRSLKLVPPSTQDAEE